MADKRKNLFGGIHPAVISVWAAVLAASHMLPAVPLIGVGGTMSVSTALAPLTGIFFGPWAGLLCAAIGNIIGDLIAPNGAWLGIFTFIVPTVNTFGAGLLSHGKKTALMGYLLYAAGLGLWLSLEIGRKAWIHGVACNGLGIIATTFAVFAGKKFLTSKNLLLKSIAIWIISYGGMMAACTFAGSMNVILFQSPAISFKVVLGIGLIERAVFSTAAMIIGVPLLTALPKIGIFVGPKSDEFLLEEVEEAQEAVVE